MTTEPEALEAAAPPPADPAPAATPAAPAAAPPVEQPVEPPPAAPAVEQAVAPPAAPPEPAPEPQRVTPGPTTTAAERGPQMVERTRRRGRRRRAPVFTPKEVAAIDYKDVDKLKKLISDRGKIEPRRKTGLTAKDQTKLAREIKRARHMALLPYTADHMRQTSRYRLASRMAERAARYADPPPPAEAPPAESAPPAPAAEVAPVPDQPAPVAAAPAAASEPPAAPAPAAEAAPASLPDQPTPAAAPAPADDNPA